MAARALRITLGLLVTLLAASFVVFGAIYAAPGDPAAFLVGGQDDATPEKLAAVRAAYHLNDPLWVQYGNWIGGVLHGDFGRSLQYNDQVADLVSSRVPTTLFLVLYSAVLFVVVGVALGVLSAVRGGRVDSIVVAVTTLLASIPKFVKALALVAFLGVQLGWFPVTGAGTGFGDRLYHLTLPALSLALGELAVVSRVTRQSMLEQFAQDHVAVARAAGLAEHKVIRRHVLRNALAPVVTMCGLIVASLFAGTVVIETAFGISGMGSLLVTAINTHDFPVTQAVLLLMVLAYMLVTTLVDLLHPLIDPRVRLEGSAA
ncbi:ABC transporter permease [Streptomyces sp. SID3343]|uniref:ABC transporter permease n=1 Tax=Streptomyces sp. SID3343 TaxID=2690260 RepID=UPI00136C8A73|nr:ABC transporter permease [Streptomyces sp. SID3343]MYW01541.1 ABC transporter permease subunit [Streptomyces sp. SID3343]